MFCYASLAVIAVFRFTSGFPGASGHPAPSKPEPLYIVLVRRVGGKILISKVQHLSRVSGRLSDSQKIDFCTVYAARLFAQSETLDRD